MNLLSDLRFLALAESVTVARSARFVGSEIVDDFIIVIRTHARRRLVQT